MSPTCSSRYRGTTTVVDRHDRRYRPPAIEMRGYDDETYGDAFADVYDDWYGDVSDIDATVALILGLVPESGRVLELGVGTGRLALPLALAGRDREITVTGIDTSDAMLERLRRCDPDGLVDVQVGDMVDELPEGPFDTVFVAYNTLFNLRSADRQAACFAAVQSVVSAGGRFVVEAFVPSDAADSTQAGDAISVRSMSADRVVLSIFQRDTDAQTAEGQFVELSESGGVRLRPWSIRYSHPDQLDAMATAAGFDLEHRWRSVQRDAFDDDADRHVSVYRSVT